MGDVVLVLAVAAITFASRVVFLIRPRPIPGGWVGRFLGLFPLALFVSIAAGGLAAPNGSVELTPALAAAAGGVIGALVFKRSLWGVLGAGAAFFYVARVIFG
jgi:branched-subunit amino acid transport protein